MDAVILPGLLVLFVLLVGALIYTRVRSRSMSPDQRQKDQDRKFVGGLAACGFAVAVLIWSFTSGSDSDPAASSNTACESTACKVASLDASGYVAPDDPIVAQYQAALDSLLSKCENPEATIGDFAVKAQELIANGGEAETLLSILRHVDDSIPTITPVTDCADIFAAYVTLRGGQA